jgi:hypothetical protein
MTRATAPVHLSVSTTRQQASSPPSAHPPRLVPPLRHVELRCRLANPGDRAAAFGPGPCLEDVQVRGVEVVVVALVRSLEHVPLYRLPSDAQERADQWRAKGPWGAQTRSSCRGLVFVEESAEEVASSDLRRVEGRCGLRIGSAAMIRRSEVEPSVWTLLVEVADVDAEDVLEVTAADDQEPVETLPSDAADPAFGVGVRVRRQHRRPDDLDAFAAEDGVEGAAELRVAVVD